MPVSTAILPAVRLPSALRFALIAGLALCAARLSAVEVELRLVSALDQTQTVDRFEKIKPVVTAVSTAKGVELKKIGIAATLWSRNVLLDGKPLFERYHDGRYVDRLPLAKAQLAAGQHTIWPGDHVFTVAADGTLATADPTLVIEGARVLIKAWPVTVGGMAAAGDTGEGPVPLPPLTIRDATDALTGLRPDAPPGSINNGSKELLSSIERFAPLTIWLPANSVGRGYLLHPVGLSFHLGDKGVVAGAGGGAAVPGVRVAPAAIQVPLYAHPLIGDPGARLVVTDVQELIWPTPTEAVPGTSTYGDGIALNTSWHPRSTPYELRLDALGPSLLVDGDLALLPVKTGRLAITDRTTGAQRLVLAELAGRHLVPGQTLHARIRAQDVARLAVANRDVTAARSRKAEAEAARAALGKKAGELKAALEKAEAADKPALQQELDAATARDPALAAAIETANTTLNAATAAREAVAAAPRAGADWALSARVQTYAAATAGNDDWQTLTVTVAPAATPGATGSDGEVDLAIPANLPAGIYRLELGAASVNDAAQRIATRLWVSVATPDATGVGIFTKRGRTVFQRGEDFWLAVTAVGGATLPAGGLDLALVDADGARLPLLAGAASTAPAAGATVRRTFIAHLPAAASAALAPGRYRVEATIAGRAAPPLAIELVDTAPATHFTNLLSGKYSSSHDMYDDVLKRGDGAARLAAGIADQGFNAFMGMSYDFDRLSHPGQDLEQLVRERPQLGPWESFYRPSGRELFMDEALRSNLRFYENLITYHDTQLPRAEPFVDASARYTSLEVASMREHPAFTGVCLYDEIYWVAPEGIPPAVQLAMDGAEEAAFRAAVPGMTTEKSGRALDRFISAPVGKRDRRDLLNGLSRDVFRDKAWGDFSVRLQAAAKRAMPGSSNFTMQRFFGENGGNIAPCGTATAVNGPMDVATCVMYKDGGVGDRPVFAPLMADVLRTRPDQPVWSQLFGCNGPTDIDAVMRQALFGISQQVEGFSFFNFGGYAGHVSYLDQRDTFRNVTSLTTRYGDLLLALKRGYRQVAVYYSLQADLLGSRKPEKLQYTCEGLWVACMRAGFPADFLYDEQVLAGEGERYKAIFVPGFTVDQEASPELLAALKKLIDSGRTLIVERACKLELEGLVRLDSDLDEYDDKLGGAFPRFVDFEFDMVFEQSKELTALVRGALTRRVPPAAEHDQLVGPDWLAAGQGQYLVMPNFAPTGFTGSYKTLYQAPNVAKLRFPKRPPVAYDLLRMERLQPRTEGEWMGLDLDMRATPGAFVAFLPAAIAGVGLQAPSGVTAGEPLVYAVGVLDEGGAQIDAAFPLDIRLSDARGRLVHHVYRAAAPRLVEDYRIGANAAAGEWTLEVRELVSGRLARATVRVAAGKSPVAVLDERPALVRDPARVAEFIAAGGPLVIALGEDQEWVRPEAERLAKELTARGRTVRIAALDGVVRLPGDEFENGQIDGTRLWRGEVVQPGLFVDQPLILLGKRGENRLIEALSRRDALPQQLSADYPGAGRGLVDLTDRAFSNANDTLTLLSIDAAGLARCVDAVLAKPAAAVAPAAAAPLVPPSAPLAATAAAAAPESLDLALSARDWVRAIDVDAASGRTVVGTQGYGHNLFCFDAKGALQWKQFLPEHDVYMAGWCDQGRKIVAATARGYYVFLLDAADGRVIRRFAANEWPTLHWSEGPVACQQQIVIDEQQGLFIVAGETGLMAVGFDGAVRWFRDRGEAITRYLEEGEQSVAAGFSRTLVVGDVALSPDGARLAHGEYAAVGTTLINKELLTVWAYRPLILDAATGKELARDLSDPGTLTGPTGCGLSWPAGAPEPLVRRDGVAIPVHADGTPGTPRPLSGTPLPDGGTLVAHDDLLERRAADGALRWSLRDARPMLVDVDALSPDRARLYRCDRDGGVHAIDLADGRTLWTTALARSALLRPSADGVLCGDKSGRITSLAADGGKRWQAVLGALHEQPTGSYAAYLHAAVARDGATVAPFPQGIDTDGDLDGALRFGSDQLVDGGFEGLKGGEAWTAGEGAPAFSATAHGGARALELADGKLATQVVDRRLVPDATYLVEFWYRAEDAGAFVTAGAETADDNKPGFTGSRFTPARPGEWVFGRLALKTLSKPSSLRVGFEASGGRVLVDDVRLRTVRFPSANMLASAELAAIEPTHVADRRVLFEHIPQELRAKLMQRSHVAVFKQGETSSSTIFMQEQAFLHNGRLDDLGPEWIYQPAAIGFSVVLTKAAWISDVVLYLSNATPDDAYRTISLQINDLERKMPRAVALVRGNQRRFLVVHFDQPVHTDSLKILPRHPGHHETLTEIELYGSLSEPGREQQATTDGEAVTMLMGTPARVAALPEDVTGTYAQVARQNIEDPAFHTGLTVLDGVMTVGNARGAIVGFRLPPEGKGDFPQAMNWNLQSVTPTTMPARARGCLLVGSADQRLHAVADDGSHLWGFATRGRIRSSPLVVGDDVFVGCDDGRLYKVDLRSGVLIWEYITGGPVRGAPTLAGKLVCVASQDGFIHAVDADSGLPAWKSPVAEATRATIAFADGALYLGDEVGDLRSIDAASGAERWKRKLGGRVSTCPLVTPEGIVFCAEDGTIALLAADGSERWKRKLPTEPTGQPLATRTQVLVPTGAKLTVLTRADGADDARFTGPDAGLPLRGVLCYKGDLLFAAAGASTNYNIPPRTYAQYGGAAIVWRRAPAAKP